MPNPAPFQQLPDLHAPEVKASLALTPWFPAPSEDIQDLIDSVREPEGAVPAIDIESAPEH